jgi:hypothetical protein
MKLLITGICGFVRSWLAESLLDRRAELLLLSAAACIALRCWRRRRSEPRAVVALRALEGV